MFKSSLKVQIKNFVVELKFKTGITIEILFFTPSDRAIQHE